MRKRLKDRLTHDVVTVVEAARLCGLAVPTITLLIRMGKLEAVKRSTVYLLDREEVLSYARDRLTPSPHGDEGESEEANN